jgi:cytochrome c oxidase subunit 4
MTTDIDDNETDAPHDEAIEPEHHAHDGHSPSDSTFVKTFFFLAAVTALEVAISYIDIGAAFLPILLGLMILKFFTVVLVFMHVRYDAKIFGRLFYIGLALAVVVYVSMLMTFLFFDS